MGISDSISFKEVTSLEERLQLRSIAEPVWRCCYAEILSEAQMLYMLEWMYALETIEKEQAQGTKFFFINIFTTHRTIYSINFFSNTFIKPNN